MLINYSILNSIKPVSKNNQSKLEQIIKETEELEIDKLLGTAFYQEVIDNYVPTTTATTVTDKWQDLVEGCTFTDKMGNTIKHKGLIHVLCYLVYASYLEISDVNDTLTGFVQKTRPDATQISFAAIKNLVNKNREIGFNYFEKTREYLFVNMSNFPKWYIHRETKVNPTYKLSGLRKSIR